MKTALRQTTVLVTGGAGFLGGAIASAARDAGFRTHVTWRRTKPRHGIEAHRVSIDDSDQISSLVRRVAPDIVVNAIGGPHRPETSSQRLAAWRDSPMATSALLEACRNRPIRFIHLASSHEYAPSRSPHDEASPAGPISLRGVAAQAATGAVRLWGRDTGSPTVILRPFSVYGPGEPEDRVVPTLLRAALSGEPFRATSGPSSRDYVFVTDVASAAIAAMTGSVSGEFNLGSGIGTAIPDLVAAAQVATGRSITVIEDGFQPRPWDRELWVADPSRAREMLAWKAETSLIDGLERCLR